MNNHIYPHHHWLKTKTHDQHHIIVHHLPSPKLGLGGIYRLFGWLWGQRRIAKAPRGDTIDARYQADAYKVDCPSIVE